MQRFVLFARSMLQNWFSFGQEAPQVSSSLSHLTPVQLQQMMMVRKRDFNKLRVLRLHIDGNGVPQMPQGVHTPSQFRASSFEERASTLLKIDQIEAQMDQQWWKTARILAAQEKPIDPS